MIKGYVAGPAAEFERSVAVGEELRRRGFGITHPWWERVIEERKQGWASDAEVPVEYMAENAALNRRGIEQASFLLAQCRSVGGVSGGTAGEVAYAASLHRHRGLHHGGGSQGMRAVILVGEPKGFVWSFDTSVTTVATLDSAYAVLARVFLGEM